MSRPKNTLAKVLEREIPRGSSLLLAVSGGKDSVALFDGCVFLQKKLKLRLAVAHVDHSLRRSSLSDCKFVEQLAIKHDVPFFQKKLEPPSKKQNIEAWGRSERYSFFKEIAGNEKFDWVLTAHTANDVAETFLMRLVSNKELTSIDRKDSSRKLLRPMLAVSTEEVKAYIKQRKLKFREDKSNKDQKFLRNKVRHKLLPVLIRQFDKRIAETLAERALALDQDIRTLYAISEKSLNTINKHDFGSREWLKTVKDELLGFSEDIRWRLSERLMKDKLGYNIGRVKAQELTKFLLGYVAGIQLPGGKGLERSNGGVIMVPYA